MPDSGFKLGKNADTNIKVGIRKAILLGTNENTNQSIGVKDISKTKLGLNKDTKIAIGIPLNRTH